MKSAKNNALTLENIRKIVGDEFDRKLVPVFGELDAIKQDVSETKIDVKILRKDVKDGFDTLFEAVTNLNDDVDKDIN